MLPLAVFFGLFCLGLAVLAFAELQHAKLEAKGTIVHGWVVVAIPLFQHLASALIVAAVMGVSYEYFVHKKVVEGFHQLIKDNQRATEQAFDAFRTLTAREVFEFIGNVALHNSRIPTLFKPPRDAVNEILFSTEVSFFQRLTGSENARAEAVEVLGEWLDASDVQRRFLASDFIGLLRLHELEARLRELAAERQKEWKNLSEADRCCVLNFWWAASRFETPMYETLKSYLIEWNDPLVRKWILFVARQMPDAQLAHIVQLFLRTRGDEAQRDVLDEAIAAIEVLHHAGNDMTQIVTRYRSVFERVALWEAACAAVSVVPPYAQQRRGRIRRALRLFRK